MKTNKTNFAKTYLYNPTGLRNLALGVTLLSAMLSFPAQAVPSFARQTGFDCAQCHTVIPQLTPLGRQFKLDGYTMSNAKKGEEKPAAQDNKRSGNVAPDKNGRPTQLTDGVVEKVDLKNGKITLQHGEIVNVMPAMTMSYRVKQVQQLESIQAGDKVRFALGKMNNDYVVTHIEVSR